MAMLLGCGEWESDLPVLNVEDLKGKVFAKGEVKEKHIFAVFDEEASDKMNPRYFDIGLTVDEVGATVSIYETVTNELIGTGVVGSDKKVTIRTTKLLPYNTPAYIIVRDLAGNENRTEFVLGKKTYNKSLTRTTAMDITPAANWKAGDTLWINNTTLGWKNSYTITQEQITAKKIQLTDILVARGYRNYIDTWVETPAGVTSNKITSTINIDLIKTNPKIYVRLPKTYNYWKSDPITKYCIEIRYKGEVLYTEMNTKEFTSHPSFSDSYSTQSVPKDKNLVLQFVDNTKGKELPNWQTYLTGSAKYVSYGENTSRVIFFSSEAVERAKADRMGLDVPSIHYDKESFGSIRIGVQMQRKLRFEVFNVSSVDKITLRDGTTKPFYGLCISLPEANVDINQAVQIFSELEISVGTTRKFYQDYYPIEPDMFFDYFRKLGNLPAGDTTSINKLTEPVYYSVSLQQVTNLCGSRNTIEFRGYANKKVKGYKGSIFGADNELIPLIDFSETSMFLTSMQLRNSKELQRSGYENGIAEIPLEAYEYRTFTNSDVELLDRYSADAPVNTNIMHNSSQAALFVPAKMNYNKDYPRGYILASMADVTPAQEASDPMHNNLDGSHYFAIATVKDSSIDRLDKSNLEPVEHRANLRYLFGHPMKNNLKKDGQIDTCITFRHHYNEIMGIANTGKASERHTSKVIMRYKAIPLRKYIDMTTHGNYDDLYTSVFFELNRPSHTDPDKSVKGNPAKALEFQTPSNFTEQLDTFIWGMRYNLSRERSLADSNFFTRTAYKGLIDRQFGYNGWFSSQDKENAMREGTIEKYTLKELRNTAEMPSRIVYMTPISEGFTQASIAFMRHLKVDANIYEIRANLNGTPPTQALNQLLNQSDATFKEVQFFLDNKAGKKGNMAFVCKDMSYGRKDFAVSAPKDANNPTGIKSNIIVSAVPYLIFGSIEDQVEDKAKAIAEEILLKGTVYWTKYAIDGTKILLTKNYPAQDYTLGDSKFVAFFAFVIDYPLTDTAYTKEFRGYPNKEAIYQWIYNDYFKYTNPTFGVTLNEVTMNIK